MVDGRLEFIADPPLLVPIEDVFSDQESDAIDATIREVLQGDRETLDTDRRNLLDSYEYVRAARKVVGVGSVGTRAWVVLFTGRDEQDPFFLQVKEAQAPWSTPSPRAGCRRRQGSDGALLGGRSPPR